MDSAFKGEGPGGENWEVDHFEAFRISWESPQDLISYFLQIFQTKY